MKVKTYHLYRDNQKITQNREVEIKYKSYIEDKKSYPVEFIRNHSIENINKGFIYHFPRFGNSKFFHFIKLNWFQNQRFLFILKSIFNS